MIKKDYKPGTLFRIKENYLYKFDRIPFLDIIGNSNKCEVIFYIKNTDEIIMYLETKYFDKEGYSPRHYFLFDNKKGFMENSFDHKIEDSFEEVEIQK
jgi:hypothetical protein